MPNKDGDAPFETGLKKGQKMLAVVNGATRKMGHTSFDGSSYMPILDK